MNRKVLTLFKNNFKESRKLFNREERKILEASGGVGIQVEHIGSTAVPGTIGKGVIDILVISDNQEEQEIVKEKLIDVGYTQGELNKKPDGRFFFHRHKSEKYKADVHLHLVIKSDESLKFRDYLLAHPEEVEVYNQEKIKAAKKAQDNRREYQVNKEKYVIDLSDRVNKDN